MLSLLQTIVVAFGITVGIGCVAGAFAPHTLVQIVKRVWESKWGVFSAVLVRLLLGLALIFAAAGSKFPLTFTVIGGVSLVAAFVIGFAGRERMSKLVAVFERLSGWLVRLWLSFGIAFGGFLVYGAW
jgi:hypothetical protein